MDPLQRNIAPKRHPLAFPTKTDKAETKTTKQVKPQETIKIAKEQTIIQKPLSDPQPSVNPKIEQKQEKSENKQGDDLPSKKVESVPAQEIKQQAKISQIEVKMETKEGKPQQTVPIVENKSPQPTNISKAQPKNAQKRQVKDILGLTAKNKPSLQPPKTMDQILPPKSEFPQKKQINIAQSLFSEPKAISTEAVPKKEQTIERHLEIGEKVQRKETDKHPVRIQINESSQKGTGLLKTTYYHITGEDDHGSFTINRKYDEFEALNEILHERWPGCFLPALSKESEGRKEGERDRHLRTTLASFLVGLSYSSHVYYREEVQLFLRSPDVDASEMFRKMPALKTRDVISRLRSSFGELLDQPVTEAFKTRISSFVATLRKIIGSLGTLSLKALSLSQAYEGYSQCLGRFSRAHKAYEQLSLHEFREIGGERGVVIHDTEHKLDRLQELTKHNPFLKLHSFLSNEARDAEAFLEVIIASELFVLRKEDLDREIRELQAEIEGIMLGHKSLKTMASRRSKEEVQGELEQRQKRLGEERETMVEMFSLLQILLATRSIAQFQAFKRDNYRSILEEWAQVVQQATPELEAVWQFIAEDSRAHLKP